MNRSTKAAFLASAFLAAAASGHAALPSACSLSDQPFSQVVWDGKQFIAFGPTDLISTSTDGIAWTKSSASFPNFMQAASSGHVTVAVDEQILSSTDGRAWSPVSLPAHWVGFSSVVWTGKRFLLNGVFNSVDSIAISEDGKAWSLVNIGEGASTRGLPQSYAISPKGVVMAGMGGISFSADSGLTWKKAATASGSIGVVWRGGIFISATENGGLQTSTDGLVWTTRTAIADTLAKLAGGGNVWNEIGELNGKAYLVGSHAFLSVDGLNWTLDTAFLSQWSMHRAAMPTRISNIQPVHGKLFLFGGKGSIWSGTNGSDWNACGVSVSSNRELGPVGTAWRSGSNLILQMNAEEAVSIEAVSLNGSRLTLVSSRRMGAGTHSIPLNGIEGFSIVRVRIGNKVRSSIPVVALP